MPLLVTGIAGVAGYNALQYFQRQFPGQVIGIRRRKNWPLRGPGIVACDIYDRVELKRLFAQYRFQSVLHCEGTCALKSCELDPLMAWRVNVLGLMNLLDCLAGSSTRLVHLSVDLVYSGAGRGGYREHDPTDPVTVYGKTMVLTEQLVLRERPASCVLRISLPMGISFNGHAGAIDWIQSRFRKNKPATLYLDETRTPAYTDCLNALFHCVLFDPQRRTELSGLFHAGGPRRLSLYQIAQIINRVGGYDPRLLIGCPRSEAGPLPPRAGNVALNSSKLNNALVPAPLLPWPYAKQLVPTDRQWHWRRPTDQPGSTQWLQRVLYRNPLRLGRGHAAW